MSIATRSTWKLCVGSALVPRDPSELSEAQAMSLCNQEALVAVVAVGIVAYIDSTRNADNYMLAQGDNRRQSALHRRNKLVIRRL